MRHPDSLSAAIGRAVAELSPGAVDTLVERLRRGESAAAVAGAVPTSQYRSLVAALLDASRAHAEATGPALALAIDAAREREDAARTQRVSIVWTGPETDAVAVRRTDQALLELIQRATRRLIIVSFAVYKVRDVTVALDQAGRRGCEVAIVLESDSEVGGRVAFNREHALGRENISHAKFYTWPAELRPETVPGSRASLHAKCAVADERRLLVSSANLTDYAFTKNIELGLLVEGGDVPVRVQAHLEALFANGQFRPTSPR